MKERDEARNQLLMLQQHFGNSQPAHQPQSENMEISENTQSTEASKGLSAQTIEKFNKKNKELTAMRKGRKAPETLNSKENISSFSQKLSFTAHSTDKPGVTCMFSKNLSDNTDLFVSGGNDKNIYVNTVDNQANTNNTVCKLSGHSKRINDIVVHNNNLIYSASMDKTIKAWKPKGDVLSNDFSYDEVFTIASHDDEVSNIHIHPTGDFIISSSKDGSYSIFDIEHNSEIQKVFGNNDAKSTQLPYFSSSLHPDGLILATGTGNASTKSKNKDLSQSSLVQIWDIRENKNVHVFNEFNNDINTLQFSENGYYLAAGSEDGNVKIFDLRKLKCAHTIELNQPVKSVRFDSFGVYLAIASGNDVNIQVVKEWNNLTVITFNLYLYDITFIFNFTFLISSRNYLHIISLF